MRSTKPRNAPSGTDDMNVLVRLLLLRSIDTHWVNHLTNMENLRTGVGLQAVGQRDPLTVYRTEGQKAFAELTRQMQRDVTHTLYSTSRWLLKRRRSGPPPNHLPKPKPAGDPPTAPRSAPWLPSPLVAPPSRRAQAARLAATPGVLAAAAANTSAAAAPTPDLR